MSVSNSLNCMQSIPLAVLKQYVGLSTGKFNVLHAIHTACGIETRRGENVSSELINCMQSIPLAVLKQDSSGVEVAHFIIACNPYRLRY